MDSPLSTENPMLAKLISSFLASNAWDMPNFNGIIEGCPAAHHHCSAPGVQYP